MIVDLELQLYQLLNSVVGKSATLDSCLRFLAVWGPLWAAWEVARPWLAGDDPKRCLRIMRDALVSGAAALLLSLVMARAMPRARPFLSHPAVLLYLVPNNLSFPDTVIALGTGLTCGAVYRQRGRWLAAGVITFLWVLARMVSGTIHPLDGIAAIIVGALPAGAEAFVARLPMSRWEARGGIAALVLVVGAAAWYLHSARPKLPLESTTSEHMGIAAEAPERPGADPRIKGFMPSEEARVLRTLDAVSPPLPVERVAIGADRWERVAGIKLRAGDHWDARSRRVTEWNAARALQAVLRNHPELAEIDLWAVVPFRAPQGKEALRPVLFLQAGRAGGRALMHASPAQLLMDAHRYLSAFPSLYTLPHDFPQPGVRLPNGVAEGAG